VDLVRVQKQCLIGHSSSKTLGKVKRQGCSLPFWKVQRQAWNRQIFRQRIWWTP